MAIASVAVIGSGIMGHGIAQVSATAGLPVQLYDISDAVLEKAKAKIESSLERGIKIGKIDPDDKTDILSRIAYESDFSQAVQGVDLVVEAVSEKIELKQTIFKKLDDLTQPATILASNVLSAP